MQGHCNPFGSMVPAGKEAAGGSTQLERKHLASTATLPVAHPPSGVLRQAKLEGPVHGTSIDHKIAQRLSKGGAKAADNQRKGSAKAAGNKRRRVEESEEEEEAEGDSDEELGAEEDGDEDEDEEDDDEDDDAPLPGAGWRLEGGSSCWHGARVVWRPVGRGSRPCTATEPCTVSICRLGRA